VDKACEKIGVHELSNSETKATTDIAFDGEVDSPTKPVLGIEQLEPELQAQGGDQVVGLCATAEVPGPEVYNSVVHLEDINSLQCGEPQEGHLKLEGEEGDEVVQKPKNMGKYSFSAKRVRAIGINNSNSRNFFSKSTTTVTNEGIEKGQGGDCGTENVQRSGHKRHECRTDDLNLVLITP
jgi:hypothetical protein